MMTSEIILIKSLHYH